MVVSACQSHTLFGIHVCAFVYILIPLDCCHLPIRQYPIPIGSTPTVPVGKHMCVCLICLLHLARIGTGASVIPTWRVETTFCWEDLPEGGMHNPVIRVGASSSNTFVLYQVPEGHFDMSSFCAQGETATKLCLYFSTYKRIVMQSLTGIHVCRCGLGKSGSASMAIFTQEKTLMTMEYVSKMSSQKCCC